MLRSVTYTLLKRLGQIVGTASEKELQELIDAIEKHHGYYQEAVCAATLAGGQYIREQWHVSDYDQAVYNSTVFPLKIAGLSVDAGQIERYHAAATKAAADAEATAERADILVKSAQTVEATATYGGMALGYGVAIANLAKIGVQAGLREAAKETAKFAAGQGAAYFSGKAIQAALPEISRMTGIDKEKIMLGVAIFQVAGQTRRLAKMQAANAAPKSAPDFIVSKNGTVYPVPKGASGPIPAGSGKGFQFTGGSGGHGLSPKTTDVRIMDPVTSGKYQYPGGYGSYGNAAGQTVNPLSGQTIPKSDPWSHIPAE